MALDPTFPTKPYIYVLYTLDAPIGGTPPPGERRRTSDNCPTPPGADDRRLRRQRTTVPPAGRRQRHDRRRAGADRRLVPAVPEPLDRRPSSSAPTARSTPAPATAPASPRSTTARAAARRTRAAIRRSAVGGTQTPPTAEGGALRVAGPAHAGRPGRARRPVIRVDPRTGAALPDNPLRRQHRRRTPRRIVAYGLRNPFRMTIRPGTNEICGSATSAGTTGRRSTASPTRRRRRSRTSAGPATRASAAQPGYRRAEPQHLQQPVPAAGTVDRRRTSRTGTARASSPARPAATGGSSITGLAVLSRPAAPTRRAYNGALFFADYTRDCIWAMLPGPNGAARSDDVATFATGRRRLSPVDLVDRPRRRPVLRRLVGGTIRRIQLLPATTGRRSRVVAHRPGQRRRCRSPCSSTLRRSTDADPAIR